MAKRKKAKRKKTVQQRIPGTYDETTLEIERLAEEHVSARRARQDAKELEDETREKLIEAMHAAKSGFVRIDGYELRLREETKPKVDVKRLIEQAPEIDPDPPLPDPDRPRGKPVKKVKKVPRTRSGKPKTKPAGRTPVVIPIEEGEPG